MRASVERQPVDEGGRKPARARFGEIAGVGGEDVVRALPQQARGGGQRAGFLLGRRVGDDAGGGAGARADLAHGGGDVGLFGENGGHRRLDRDFLARA